MSDTPSQKIERPLSPHLQIYKPQLTSITSILHRATGYAMSVGLVLLTFWLAAAAAGPEYYQVFTDFCGSFIGKLLLFGWTLAFYYHLANGIRHLIWDSGFLFEIKNACKAGYFVLGFTALATVLSWICVLNS